MARIYLASSWRNEDQPRAVALLRNADHEVYDFRHPTAEQTGFRWEAAELTQAEVSEPTRLLSELHLNHTMRHFYLLDFRALEWCDTCIMLNPCGVSAALELGYCVGRGKRGIIVLNGMREAELMYLMATDVVLTFDDALGLLSKEGRGAVGGD